jgi:3-deoxy-7-phosphoheptulonate synthase
MNDPALLGAVGRCARPVLLEWSGAATLDEWLLAAEAILAAGNPQVILYERSHERSDACSHERGSQPWEPAPHTSLGLDTIPLAKIRTHLPIVVEPSHGTGRRELVLPMSLAAIAAGAHGLLIEMAERFGAARSEVDQAIDPATLRAIIRRAALVKVASHLPSAPAMSASTRRSAGESVA